MPRLGLCATFATICARSILLATADVDGLPGTNTNQLSGRIQLLKTEQKTMHNFASLYTKLTLNNILLRRQNSTVFKSYASHLATLCRFERPIV